MKRQTLIVEAATGRVLAALSARYQPVPWSLHDFNVTDAEPDCPTCGRPHPPYCVNTLLWSERG